MRCSCSITTPTLLGSAIAFAVVLGSSSANAALLPGTPLGAANFGTVDIVDGINILPGPVTSGDLVLQESPTGGTGKTNWSNVVRFYNFINPFGFGPSVVGYAYHMSDGDAGAGLPNIQLIDLISGAQVLPDEL